MAIMTIKNYNRLVIIQLRTLRTTEFPFSNYMLYQPQLLQNTRVKQYTQLLFCYDSAC